MNQPTMIGHGTHRYKTIAGWGQLDPAKHPVKDCHEMVMDSQGRLFMLTNDTRNNMLIYNKDGHLTGSWGTTYPGAHGLTLWNENGTEFLLITDYDRRQVIKTTLEGKEVMVIGYPRETGQYKSEAAYRPTETAVAPNGDIYVTDGYGLQYVIQYNYKGEFIRHWGGMGEEPGQFDCVHGVAVDLRNPAAPSLLITSRNRNQMERFTTDGKYIETIHLPGSFVCRPVIHKDHVYAAVFRSVNNQNPESGYITILDKNNQVVSTPGGTEPVYMDGVLQPQKQEGHVFMHPHDVCVDDEENLYVPQWNSHQTYPLKLVRIKE